MKCMILLKHMSPITTKLQEQLSLLSLVDSNAYNSTEVVWTLYAIAGPHRSEKLFFDCTT